MKPQKQYVSRVKTVALAPSWCDLTSPLGSLHSQVAFTVIAPQAFWLMFSLLGLHLTGYVSVCVYVCVEFVQPLRLSLDNFNTKDFTIVSLIFSRVTTTQYLKLTVYLIINHNLTKSPKRGTSWNSLFTKYTNHQTPCLHLQTKLGPFCSYTTYWITPRYLL